MPSRICLRPAPALLALLFAAAGCLPLAAQGDPSPAPQELQSPDGRIAVTVVATGVLSYRVSVDGTPVLNDSRLGLRLRGGVVLGQEVALIDTARSESDTVWTNPLGKRREVRDHYRELAIKLRERGGGGRTFSVVFRAFNDGVGFRYVLPGGEGPTDVVIEEELTQFAFTADSVCFAGDHVAVPPDDYDSRGGFHGSQEWEFRRQRLSDLPIDTVTGLPMLTHTPAAWVAVTEAELVDWAGR
jgi:alpha-glucosidase